VTKSWVMVGIQETIKNFQNIIVFGPVQKAKV